MFSLLCVLLGAKVPVTDSTARGERSYLRHTGDAPSSDVFGFFLFFLDVGLFLCWGERSYVRHAGDAPHSDGYRSLLPICIECVSKLNTAFDDLYSVLYYYAAMHIH